MDTKFRGLPETDRQIVYIRPVPVSDLPEEVQAAVGEVETVYSVHRPDGEQVALVKDRAMAFALARQNDLSPVSVH